MLMPANLQGSILYEFCVWLRLKRYAPIGCSFVLQLITLIAFFYAYLVNLVAFSYPFVKNDIHKQDRGSSVPRLNVSQALCIEE